MRATIWHNPRCRKSREALALLEQAGVDLEVRQYLEHAPTLEELRATLKLLGKKASEIVRRGEQPYRDLELAGADEEKVLAAMVAHPILIERPIVICGGKAVVARPPSDATKLIT